MAQADGYVNIEVNMNVSNAAKDLKQLENDIKKTKASIEKMGNEKIPLEQQYERAVAKADEVRENLNRMKDELAQAQATLDSYPGFDMPYEEFMQYLELVKTLPAQISAQETAYAKAGGEVDKLYDKLQTYDDKLKQANTRLAEMQDKAGGLARELSEGMDEKAYQDVVDRVEDIVEAQEEVATSAEKTAKAAGIFERLGGVLKEVAQAAGSAAVNVAKVAGQGVANGLKGTFSGLSSVAKAAGQGIVSGLKLALSGLKSLGSLVGSAARGFASLAQSAGAAFAKMGQSILGFVGHMNVFSKLASGLSGKLARLGTMIKQAFVFNVISQGLRALRGQISSYLSQNAAFTSALNSLQGALSTAFQPILNAAVPALVTLMNVIASVISVIGRLLAALASIGGRSKSNTKALNDQTKAIGGAGGAAAEASKSLAKFDEINRLSADSGGGGGGGGGAGEAELPDYEFETSFNTWGEAFNAFLDTIIEDGIPRLRAALLDFASWLNGLSANVYEMFTFPGVQDKVRYIGEQVAEAFNDMVDAIDWNLLGRAIGAGLNTALVLAVGFLYTFDWINAGRSLAASINGLVDEVNWYDFGKLLWSGFKIGLETLAGFIQGLNMPAVTLAFSNLIKGFFNSALETVNNIDWALIGRQIADFLNTFDWYGTITSALSLITTALSSLKISIDSFLTNWDWQATATQIYTAINNAVHNIDWAGIGATLGSLFSTALNFLLVAIAGVDWAGIGAGLAASVQGVFASINWGELGTNFGNGVISLLNGIRGLITGMDWAALTNDLWNGLVSFVQGVDWGGVVAALFEAFGASVGAQIAYAIGLAKAVWDTIVNALLSVGDYFNGKIEECGKNTGLGILKGIWDAIKGIGAWIKKNIFDPFIKGFKSAFGIHSPSTVMKEQGKFIIEGLLKGITAAWKNIVSFFKDKLDGIKTTISNAWNAIKTTASTVWETITNNLSTAWNSIKTKATTLFNQTKEKIGEAWTNVKTFATTTWNNITTTLSTTWTNLKNTAVITFNAARDKIDEAWTNVKTFTTTTWNNIKTTLSTTWTNLKTTATTTFNAAKDAIGKAWTNAQTFTSTTWNTITTTLTTKWSNIKTAAEQKFNQVKESIGTAWENTKNKSGEIWNTVTTNLGTAWNNLRNTASEKFEDIKNKLTSTWQESETNTSIKMRAISQVVGEQAAAALRGLNDNFSKAQSAITNPLSDARNSAEGLGWYGLGSNIVDGISAGVRARAAQLANSVANAASTALRAAKNALGIHSPSTVARDELGANFMKGFAVGIDQNQGVVDSSMEDMADGMTDSLSDLLSPNELMGRMREFLQSLTDGIREAVAALAELRQAMANFNMRLPMPAIASGTVIPQSREFLSVINSQSGNASGITSADVERAVENVLSRMGGIGGGEQTVILQLDKQVLGQVVYTLNNEETQRIGLSLQGV